MRETIACSMATPEQIPSASAWCRRRMGWAEKIAFLMIFATFRISGLSFSSTSEETRNGISGGSARASRALSIRSLTASASSPERMDRFSTSIWSWFWRIITSPTILTMSPSSASGYARTPASTNAAAFSVPESSTIVKMVGPLVCLICAISPSMRTVLPTFPPSSERRTAVDFFSTISTVYTGMVTSSRSMFPLLLMFVTLTRILSRSRWVVRALLLCTSPLTLSFNCTNVPKFANPWTRPIYVFPISTSPRSHPGPMRYTRLFVSFIGMPDRGRVFSPTPIRSPLSISIGAGFLCKYGINPRVRRVIPPNRSKESRACPDRQGPAPGP
ncbi:MAG: hypothetical protein A4E37_01827 [Methanoregulaceae archaeon PtaB.Bin056]|nr:MAG: hypothetical protein A4E37_01827 [Methanoregulaceae archaeon PtaB.Bin056]